MLLPPPLPGPQNAASGRRLGSLSGRFRNAPPRQFSLFQSFGGRSGDLPEASAGNKILMLQRYGDFAAGKCVRLGILLAGWETPGICAQKSAAQIKNIAAITAAALEVKQPLFAHFGKASRAVFNNQKLWAQGRRQRQIPVEGRARTLKIPVSTNASRSRRLFQKAGVSQPAKPGANLDEIARIRPRRRRGRNGAPPSPFAPCKPLAGAFYFKPGGVITVRTQAPRTGRKTFQNPDSFGVP